MSNTLTKRLLERYMSEASPQMFLSSLFQSPARNFHNSEEVEIDIIRTDEDVSVAIQDLSTGTRMNSADLFTNKGFKPAIHSEGIPLNSFDLLKRNAGDNPFETPDFRANLIDRFMSGMRKAENKIRRAIELQASQVLQTGIVTSTDENGAAVYTIDFKPKATHFPTSAVGWGAVGATILADIASLANVIRTDGLEVPDQLIMGAAAWENFITDDEVQKRFDNRRIDQGTVSPMTINSAGGIFRGVVEIENYKYDIWTYDGQYNNPQGGAKKKFVDADNVILRASSGRLDATFGAIPHIGNILGISRNLIPELPTRFSDAGQAIDMTTFAWVSPDGSQLFGSVGTRPLMIPTAIDTFGTLDTQP